MQSQDSPQLTPLQQAAISRKLLEAKIIARAWSDETFRAQLEADPVKALTEAGFPLPKGKTIRVSHETDAIQIILPPKPSSAEEASDDELSTVAGGGWMVDGQCDLHEKARNDIAARIFLNVGELIGASWLWG